MKVVYWVAYVSFWALWGVFNFFAEGFFTSSFDSLYVSVPLFVACSVALAFAGRAIFGLVFSSMKTEAGGLPGW